MATLIDVLPHHSFDEARLAAYLSARIPGLGRPKIRQFQGGQSNPTFLLESEAGRFVLRKKPPGVLLPSAHQVEREFRVISALYGTAAPVPRPVLLCEDSEVIGAAFYVMELVEGRLFEHPALPELEASERRPVFDAMNATLAALHGVDWKAVGLADYGKPENYLGRQLDRWTKQYRSSATQADPFVDELIGWLAANKPAGGDVAIAHGDYRLGNLIFAPDAPRVAAILDWELSTLGDPLGDLAYCCLPYHMPSDMPGLRGLKGLDVAALGIPSEEEFVADYCRRTGRPGIPQWTFYLAFSLFRLTAILQGVYARALAGNAANANALEVGERATQLARTAHTLAIGG